MPISPRATRLILAVKLGKRIRERRLALNLTLTECQDLSGLLPSAWTKIELGTRAPDLVTLIKIASALSCTTDHLLLGKPIQ